MPQKTFSPVEMVRHEAVCQDPAALRLVVCDWLLQLVSEAGWLDPFQVAGP